MKKLNKILSIILAILMVISIIPITASAAVYSDTCGYNVIWSFDESTGTLTISGTGDMYDGEFSYPSWDTHIIESVIISEGVTSIGEDAFCYDTTIKNVSIADSVTDIGDGAFYNCTGLTDVIIGNGVTNIGAEAFYNCTGLTDVVIGKGVTKIGISAFEDCSNLKTVTIYNAVETIGKYSFTGCSELTDVYYFGTEAEWNAISKGSTLGGIIVCGTGLENKTIHFLDEGTHECSYNAVVTAPTCTEQGYTTYTCECGNTYVDDYVGALGHIDNDNNNCCDKCSKYILPTSGTYGDNVTWTFDESTGTLTFSGTGEMQYATSHGVPWHGHINSIERVVISEGVTTIGDKVFYNHKNIKNVSIADSVTAIDDEAFYNCTGLTDVVIGKGVTTIGDKAFYECSNLKTVTIYNAVEEIGKYSFSNCSKLTDVYYLGTEAEWNAITKATILSKTGLEKATIHFLGEETHECSYNAVVTPPTCTEQGYTTYTCECGDSYVDDYVNATGHNYSSEITTPATHTTTGVMTYTCSCGDTYTETIEKIEKHNYESFATAPNCTEQGYTTYSCECGDSYVADYVDALGHIEETVPAVAPTCTETGLTAGAKCSVCGETLTEQKELPANGHTPANAVEENYVAPSCIENGSKDVVVYCSVCNEEINRETVVIDATGHNYTAVTTAPTCTEQGYTTYTCDCGETYVDNYVNATGHADNDGDGYCDECDEELEFIVLCDHNCHKGGISGFFWKISNFFNRIFGLKKYCECGAAHY